MFRRVCAFLRARRPDSATACPSMYHSPLNDRSTSCKLGRHPALGYGRSPGGFPMLRRSTPALALTLLIALAVRVRAEVPSPTIEGPITSPGSAFVGGMTSFDLAQL